jgi:hypothetical protein
MKTLTTDPNHTSSTLSENQLRRHYSLLRQEKFFLLALLGAGWLTTFAHADALTGYYTAVAVGDPDFYGGVNAPTISVMGNGNVQSKLGPNGLPVLSASGISLFGTSSDMNPVTHELLWWSAGADPFVSHDPIPVQINSDPMNFGYPNVNWYVTGQTGDQNFYRSVHWQGTFNMASAGPISLFLQDDDDTWLFIDGNLVTECHYNAVNPSPTMSAGAHSIDIFYDDRMPVYNQFVFSSSVPMSPIPEPGAMTLLAFGAFCLLSSRARRQK